MKYTYYIITEYQEVLGCNEKELADHLADDAANIVINAESGELLEADSETSEIPELSEQPVEV